MFQHIYTFEKIFQFYIILSGITPPIYRTIQVSEGSTFWDLHVAIQDAFGWSDSHLHEFCATTGYSKKGQSERIGYPNEDGFEDETPLVDWEVPLNTFFTQVGDIIHYTYDFGDNWEHEILLEGIFIRPHKGKFPKCIDGERAVPPEDCGGIMGYSHLSKVLKNPEHEEYKDLCRWLRGTTGKRKLYDPEYFEISKVKFSDPKKRLEVIS